MGEKINRSWHENFVKYTKSIADHPNYAGLHITKGKDGRVKWVVTGKSEEGQLRQTWWNNKMQELGVKSMAEAARIIHPTKQHVCQCCGKSLSIYYEYPNKRTLKRLHHILGITFKQSDYTIKEIIEKLCDNKTKLLKVASLFGINQFRNKDDLINQIYSTHRNGSTLLSPGVMSNPPDRFDGFHSDGLCCREKTDIGRHADNMRNYGQDRRAYEHWSDGNYNLANAIMTKFSIGKRMYQCLICGKTDKMSADHIGPISLGFCHSQYNFAPMCRSCNSAKNNRFTLEDVKKLIALESQEIQVISWHSKYVWDALKMKVSSDEDAKKLSSIMVSCHHNILHLLSIIYKATGETFLRNYLHPEYSLFKYKIKNFNPLNISKLEIEEISSNSRNNIKNSQRIVRIAFETLKEFDKKNNRRTRFYTDTVKDSINDVITLIKQNNFKDADILLRKAIQHLTSTIISKETAE